MLQNDYEKKKIVKNYIRKKLFVERMHQKKMNAKTLCKIWFTAERLANRRKESKSKISAWIKARLIFALIRTMLLCLHGTRTPANVENISEIDLCVIVAESNIE